jgi:transposase
MHIDIIPNRNSSPAILLRKSFREGKKIRKQTLANLSELPMYQVESIRRILKGDKLVSIDEVFQIVENGSPQHGHVDAALIAMRRLGFANLISSRPSRERDLVIAMVAARILEAQSKLATTQWWQETTLPEILNIEDADEDDLYAAMDWLLPRQDIIEQKLAGRHLEEGGLALYDLSSSYFEGVTCPLAALGHNRDGKKGKLQVNYGLLTNDKGIPVSVSVFEGNTGDPKTLLPQVYKMRDDFGIEQFVIVGDRGMITQKQIDPLSELEGIDWITALRSEAIGKLVKDGSIQLELFDERNLFETIHPDFPGERLVACRNPALAQRRSTKRKALLEATVKELATVRGMVERGRLIGKEAIRERIDKVAGTRTIGKQFMFDIHDDGFDFEIDQEKVVAEKTSSLVNEFEKIRGMIERGRLVGRQAISERVAKAVSKRKVGRHFRIDMRDDGFDFEIDNEAVVGDATAAMVKQFKEVRRRVEGGQLYGKDAIGVRVGKVINKYKVGKHFKLDIRDNSFDFAIDEDLVSAETALDGIYVVRTSLTEEMMTAENTVRSYKLLCQAERAFRSFKSIDLKVRPIRHRLEDRVRAHIFLCMLAYYVQWHMLEAWRPLLYCDEDQEAKATRDPVAPAQRSEACLQKVRSKSLEDGTRPFSFRTLLDHLSGIVRNKCRRRDTTDDEPTFNMDTPPNPKQRQAYNLLRTITL